MASPTTPAAAAQVSLKTIALAAIAARLPEGHGPLYQEPELQYLRYHLNMVAANGSDWAAALPAYLAAPAPVDVPLVALGGELGLAHVELLSVALAAVVEDETMAGRALARVQAPLGGSRPTLALLIEMFALSGASERPPLQALADGAAVRSGLLNLAGDGPLPERAVTVPMHLCLAMAGSDGVYPGATIGTGPLPPVPLPPSILATAGRHAAGLGSAPRQGLVLRCASPAEGRAVAEAIAATLGRRPLFVETDRTAGLAPWLILRGLLPVFCFELGPGERRSLPVLPYYRGPVLALTGPDGSVEAAGGAALSWTLPVPPRAERRALWEQAIGPGELAAELAADHRHGSGRIAHLGRLARYAGVLHERSAPTREELLAASWTTEGGGLDSLAQPLTDPIPDSALVTTATLRQDLQTLLLRCRARDGLVSGLGASAQARYHPGVRALFVGPSGTGKTLAAGWLATHLGLPLYRVDLAAVTSKYIGETEKNLAQLLARAEQAEVVLLFDEADSLFGKRTDVKEANDRFANAQTNYLLQRIESYDGITLLTSNSRTRFDAAFTRRLDMIVEFTSPGPEERRALWHSHLGDGHCLAPKQINHLAVAADLSGGHIRNAVLTAAVLALSSGRPIGYEDIAEGLAGEYRKLGRQMPAEIRTGI